MNDKRRLLDELLSSMEQCGTDADHIAAMRRPEWLEQVHVESLEFLLSKYRELQALRRQNEGLYERWQQSKQQPGPDRDPP